MAYDHQFFVMASYAVAGVVLAAVCLVSYVQWRQCRADFRRLFSRKDKDARDA